MNALSPAMSSVSCTLRTLVAAAPAAPEPVVAPPTPAPTPVHQAAANVPPSDLRPPAPIIFSAPRADAGSPSLSRSTRKAAPAKSRPPPPPPQLPSARRARKKSARSPRCSAEDRKPADEPAAVAPPAAKPVTDDGGFDDELEIPAFLRRSGNAWVSKHALVVRRTAAAPPAHHER